MTDCWQEHRCDICGASTEIVPVGVNEIAQLLGAKVGTVRVWRTRGVLPAPKWILSGTPVWERDEIEAWARETGRLPLSARGTL